MTQIVLIICSTVIFCTLIVCSTWIKVEQIRKQKDGGAE